MKKQRIPKERIIFDNYDLWNIFPDEDLKRMALDCEWVESEEEISDQDLINWRYEECEDWWENEKDMLTDFFKGKTVGFFGSVGRWNGVYKASKIGEFWELFNQAITDCDYIKLYDENGHFYLTCSHHDGTCHFEIKEVTESGSEYLERWEYAWDDRSEQHVHNQIYNRYSRLPRYAEKVFGCKAKEYEPITKGRLIDMLNNQAKSFYC